MKLLEMYADEGDLQRSLNAAIRLTAYQHRWYQESSVSYSFPSILTSPPIFVLLPVSNCDCPLFVQARSNPRTCQNFLHDPFNGSPRRFAQHHARVFELRENLQGGRMGLLDSKSKLVSWCSHKERCFWGYLFSYTYRCYLTAVWRSEHAWCARWLGMRKADLIDMYKRHSRLVLLSL